MAEAGDVHLRDETLVDLALGDLDEPVTAQSLRHLEACLQCRRRYDESTAAVEMTLAASPPVEPPPDFEHSVLTAAAADPVRHRRGRRQPGPPRRGLALAAAASVGVLVGLGAAWGWSAFDDPAPRSTVVDGDAALVTASGDTVGSVARSWHGGDPVLVIAVRDGVVGKRYSCRLVLPGGAEQPAGEWVMESPRATWVVTVPDTGVEAVELVTDTGAVWSSARLG